MRDATRRRPLAAKAERWMSVRTLTALTLVLLVSPAVARDISGRATVLDGDTVRVAGVTVRLKRVDARFNFRPELPASEATS